MNRRQDAVGFPRCLDSGYSTRSVIMKKIKKIVSRVLSIISDVIFGEEEPPKQTLVDEQTLKVIADIEADLADVENEGLKKVGLSTIDMLKSGIPPLTVLLMLLTYGGIALSSTKNLVNPNDLNMVPR